MVEENKFVFISHRNKEPDQSLVLRLKKYLGDRKLNVWCDYDLRAGDRWAEKIMEKIEQATAYILVASKDSLESQEVVSKELPAMKKYEDKVFIPYYLDRSFLEFTDSKGTLLSNFRTAAYHMGSNSIQGIRAWEMTEESAFETVYEILKEKLNELQNNPADFIFNYDRTVLLNYIGKDSTVYVPMGTEKIGKAAFACSNVEKVIIPFTVTHICSVAFSNCEQLKVVEGMRGVQRCELSAFDEKFLDSNGRIVCGVDFGRECEDTISVAKNVRVIADSAYECSRAKSVQFSEGLEHIGMCAFRCSPNLHSATFPATLKSIGEQAFVGCGRFNGLFRGDVPDNLTSAFDTIHIKEKK